ncbi:hypothetical protein K505DRAFT_340767 [Melanomma pulvis-pyrius CBS 109.77]|uniref:Uncharacterized protein n=1 Tax=Melanomma pulvis-pyrius CBS 109.77 TaxID=1314802 RepID=A0A6A6X115_9PLEO|nr:hypothetical protein K505DRAFT_340767 [Melanomma pulvis-pyrius CBS 109.77]
MSEEVDDSPRAKELLGTTKDISWDISWDIRKIPHPWNLPHVRYDEEEKLPDSEDKNWVTSKLIALLLFGAWTWWLVVGISYLHLGLEQPSPLLAWAENPRVSPNSILATAGLSCGIILYLACVMMVYRARCMNKKVAALTPFSTVCITVSAALLGATRNETLFVFLPLGLNTALTCSQWSET